MENTSKKLVYMAANYPRTAAKSSRQHGNTKKKSALMPRCGTRAAEL
jgi:hypothetical protein